MSRIIERKYLVQQAVAAKLDREPTVHLDLLRSREQILAGAYVQRDLRTKVTGISNNEVDAYIQAHPERFAKRQVFQIEQATFPPQKDMEVARGGDERLQDDGSGRGEAEGPRHQVQPGTRDARRRDPAGGNAQAARREET